jgi:hypothetical protein
VKVPVLWVVTSNAGNLRAAPEASAIGVSVPPDLAALVACEWAGWGHVRILVTTRLEPLDQLAGEFDTYWDAVSPQVAQVVEAALAQLVS